MGEGAYVGEEYTWDTSLGVQCLLVTFSRRITSQQASAMAGNGVLVGFDTTVEFVSVSSEAVHIVIVILHAYLTFLPSKRKIGCRDDLDEIHEVVGHLESLLVSVIQRIDVMTSPRVGLPNHLLRNIIWQLGSEAKLMNGMGERVTACNWCIKKVLEVVDVHVAIAETASWSNVEISNDLVDSDSSLNTASFFALLVESFAVVFPFALLHAFALSESPGNAGVCLSNFLASVTTSLLRRTRWGSCTVATSTVVVSEVNGSFGGVVSGAG